MQDRVCDRRDMQSARGRSAALLDMIRRSAVELPATETHNPGDPGEPALPTVADWAVAVKLRDAARAAILYHIAEPDLALEKSMK